MLQDYKLGLRMLLKYPGLTLAGGLALAVAIGVGAVLVRPAGQRSSSPTIPLPDGYRLVVIETRNTLTNQPEARVARDFLEWRDGLRTIEQLGAYRTDTRNLVAGTAVPEPIQVAELTATAFGAAHVRPLLGRSILEPDERPGAPAVVCTSRYEVWQRSFGGRPDVIGSVVKLGAASATVIGVMPKGFAYPLNHDAWAPLLLRTSYSPLEGDAISVIGRLAPGVSLEQANAELRVFAERAAAAFPSTHTNLRPSVVRLGQVTEAPDVLLVVWQNLPVMLMLLIACTSVGTLIYARTATREGEIAVRSALGASRARIIGQLFVEALVLASVAGAVGLIAANKALTWGIESVNRSSGGAPFWMTPGLKPSTILYAFGLAILSAAMLSILPALRATRPRGQASLANLGAGGATLRFGRVWTGAMIFQVALTAMGIPVGMETVNEAMLKHGIRAAFPSGPYLAARVEAVPAARRHRAGVRGAADAGARGARASCRAGARRHRDRVLRERPRFAREGAVCRGRGGLRCRHRVRRRLPHVGDRTRLLRSVRSTHRCRARIRLERLERHGPDGDRQRSVRARLFARGEPQFSDRGAPPVSAGRRAPK